MDRRSPAYDAESLEYLLRRGQFVAAGEGGTILTSTDGLVWTKRISGNTLWLVGVGYGNGLFVVVGDQGTILTSVDGIAWTSRLTGGTRINAVANGNGIFLAVDEAGGSWSSTDGISWSFHATVQSSQLRGLVFATPIFVVTGASGTIQTTFDGMNFTRRSTGTLSNPRLALFDSNGAKLGENDDWGGGTALASAFAQVGAFALSTNGLDSALLRTPDHGLYTAQLSDVGGGTGIGLIEIYESDLQPARIVNLSC